MHMTPEHTEELRRAKKLLDTVGLAARITGVIGSPIEKGINMLPAKWSAMVNEATRRALDTALELAVKTFGEKSQAPATEIWHRVAVAATGAGGGAFGVPALLIELPASTIIMLRSIADIARSEGEEIRDINVKLACLEVFALGGNSSRDNAADSGYFAVRAALAKAVSEAAEFIAERGVAKEGAPVIVRLISLIASRFGVNVSEKVAAQAIPALGAIGGALINLAFIDHFQDVARGHFIVRRLERIYGSEAVELAYRQITTTNH